MDSFKELGHSGSPQNKIEAVLEIAKGANKISKLHKMLNGFLKMDFLFFININLLRY